MEHGAFGDVFPVETSGYSVASHVSLPKGIWNTISSSMIPHQAICHTVGSMYGIFTYFGLLIMVNVCTYSIHGAYGYANINLHPILTEYDPTRFPSSHVNP